MKEVSDLQNYLLQFFVFTLILFKAGLGPMQGQLNHFSKYCKEKIPYAIGRYERESLRLYGVLDKRLEGRDWLAGTEMTIADIANFAWVVIHLYSGISLSNFKNLDAWRKKIVKREAVVRGLQVPEATDMASLEKALQLKKSKNILNRVRK